MKGGAKADRSHLAFGFGLLLTVWIALLTLDAFQSRIVRIGSGAHSPPVRIRVNGLPEPIETNAQGETFIQLNGILLAKRVEIEWARGERTIVVFRPSFADNDSAAAVVWPGHAWAPDGPRYEILESTDATR